MRRLGVVQSATRVYAWQGRLHVFLEVTCEYFQRVHIEKREMELTDV